MDSKQVERDLISNIAICRERARIGSLNKSKAKQLDIDIESLTGQINVTKTTVNHMTAMCKNVKAFLEKKQTRAKDVLEASIRSINDFVPAAELHDAKLYFKNGKAMIINEEGQEIREREGSAVAAINGFMLKYVCVKAKPNKIQTLFLDEGFSTLSSNTAINLKTVLGDLKKDIGIVGIEQHDILYKGIADTKYEVVKVVQEGKSIQDFSGKTTVREVKL